MSATYALREEAAEALVIHCSDPRFQEAFRRFLAEELQLAHYVPLVLPGSVGAIGIQALQPKYFKTLFQQLKLLTTVNRVPRVIVINHDDCRGYESLKGFFLARQLSLAEQQQQDLVAAAGLIKEFLPQAHVDLYQCRLNGGKQLVFDKVL